MSESNPTRWLSVQEVAEQLRVSEETIRRWIRAGDLAVLDLGSPRAGYRISQAELDEFIARRYGRRAKSAA